MTYYFVIDLQDASKKLFLHDDRRIRIQSRIRSRIHPSDKWIRIREAQKQVDPDSDPQHCKQTKDLKLRVIYLNNVRRVPSVTKKRRSLSIWGAPSVLVVVPCDDGCQDLLLSPRCKSANSSENVSSAIFLQYSKNTKFHDSLSLTPFGFEAGVAIFRVWEQASDFHHKAARQWFPLLSRSGSPVSEDK